MENSKKGFTLVELLATIVILSIILVIAVPKVIDIINDSKKATLESSAKMVASEAEKRKVQNQVLGKDENITCENVSRLNDIDYEKCYIEFLNNQAYVTIIGSNKFEDMYICKGTKTESKVVDRCPNERVSVTIDPAGGIVTDLSGIYKEGDVIELENPTKDNATFLNWNVVKGNSTLSDNKLTVGSEDTIVWADYEEWGELTIDLDGGSVSNNQSGKYKSNTTIELEVPLKENYKFIEWEIIKGNGIVSGTTFTMGSNDTKIKAKWELNVFKLNVELNGGTISKDYSGDYEVGSTMTIEDPTRTGYTFTGWSVSGTGAMMSGTNLTIGTENVILSANWIVNTYEVTFNSGNLIYNLYDISTTTSEYMSYSVTNGLVTVTANQNDGYGYINARVYLEAGNTYIFNCNTNGTWGHSSGEDTVEAFLMLNGEYNTIYHMTSNNNYKFTPTITGVYWLRLDVNQKGKTHTFSNINISKVETIKTVTYNSTYGDMFIPTKVGHTFIGWYNGVAKNDSSKSYSDYPWLYYADTYNDLYKAYGYDETKLRNHYNNHGKKEERRVSQYISDDKVTITNNLYLYAGWDINTYTIYYNLNGGTSGSSAPTSGTYGSTVTVSNPTRTGYTFNGWSVSGTGTSMSGTTLTIGAGNITLTANWKVNTYTISYTLNGGTKGSSAPTSGTYGSTVTVSNPTRTGYAFNGWSVLGTGASMSGTTLTIGAGNVTLTANWKVNTYTINYVLNGGNYGAYAPTSGAYGSTVTVSNPTRTGYTFNGWSVSGTGASMSGTTLTIGAGNVTLTANWKLVNPVNAYWCANASAGSSYIFTYTGNCVMINDGGNNWRLRFLTSGTFTSTVNIPIDIFLLGGGGGGGGVGELSFSGGGGGGGGYRATYRYVNISATSYYISIGDGGSWSSAGGTSSAFGYSAAGGGGGASGIYPNVGGAGGTGGANGGNGGYGPNAEHGYAGATGGYEFDDANTGAVYGGGGGGGGGFYHGGFEGYGGAGGYGGGAGGDSNAAANTGGGGGGRTADYGNQVGGWGEAGYSGGSGIVVIRNNR